MRATLFPLLIVVASPEAIANERTWRSRSRERRAAINCRQTLLVIALGLVASIASPTVRIDIEPVNDCTAGWLSVDVAVIVNGERFSFSPSCDYAFTRRFRTHGGLECVVDAGMCSGFWSDNRFKVQCDDGSSESVAISCPTPG